MPGLDTQFGRNNTLAHAQLLAYRKVLQSEYVPALPGIC
jgi:hypothetical protein